MKFSLLFTVGVTFFAQAFCIEDEMLKEDEIVMEERQINPGTIAQEVSGLTNLIGGALGVTAAPTGGSPLNIGPVLGGLGGLGGQQPAGGSNPLQGQTSQPLGQNNNATSVGGGGGDMLSGILGTVAALLNSFLGRLLGLIGPVGGGGSVGGF